MACSLSVLKYTGRTLNVMWCSPSWILLSRSTVWVDWQHLLLLRSVRVHSVYWSNFIMLKNPYIVVTIAPRVTVTFRCWQANGTMTERSGVVHGRYLHSSGMRESKKRMMIIRIDIQLLNGNYFFCQWLFSLKKNKIMVKLYLLRFGWFHLADWTIQWWLTEGTNEWWSSVGGGQERISKGL